MNIPLSAKTNAVLKAIYERRAVRKFKKDPITAEQTEEILNAGRMAPSAINKQPWMFHVVNDPEMIMLFSAAIIESGKFSMMKEGIKEAVNAILHPGTFHLKDGLDFFKADDPIFHGAPLVVFISSPRASDWAALDVGMCAQNMMLAAKSMGIESCPVGLAKFIEKSYVYEKLKVPAVNHINLAVVFGHGDETPAGHERRKDNAIYIHQ